MTELHSGPTQQAPDLGLDSLGQGVQWSILVGCSLASVAALLQPPLWIFNPPGAQPFDAAWSNFRLLATVTGVVRITFMILGGVLGDLHGRRRIWLIGLAGFIASNLLLMISPLPGWHIPVRVLALAFGSIFLPLALATINYTFTDAVRAKAIAVYVTINACAVQLAWIQGQFLYGRLGWRAAYILPILVALFAIYWVYHHLAGTHAGRQRRLDIIIQSGWTLLVIAIFYGLAVLPVAADHWAYVMGVALLVGLVGGGVVFWWNLNTSKDNLRHRSFRARDLTALIITGAMLNFLLMGFTLRTFGLFQETLSMPSIVAAIALAPLLLGLIAALSVFLKAMRKYQARAVIASGMIVMAASMVGAALIPLNASYLLYTLPLFFFGAGYLVASTVWTSAFLRTSVTNYYGVTAAMSSAITLIGGAIGSALTGNLFAQLGAELYISQLLHATLNLPEAVETLTGYQSLPPEAPAYSVGATTHLHFGLLDVYREIYTIAYAQILWLMVFLCLGTAVIIAVGLRSSLRATTVSSGAEELLTA